MNEEEKRLLDGFSRLSQYNKHIALAQITYAAEFEEIARRIARGGRDRLNRPEYANRDPAPMGEAAL
jgi:hypothetical protein